MSFNIEYLLKLSLNMIFMFFSQIICLTAEFLCIFPVMICIENITGDREKC